MASFKWKIGGTTFEEQFNEDEINESHAKPKALKFKKPISKSGDLKPDEKDNKDNSEEDLPLDEGLPSIGDCIFGFHTMALVAEAVKNKDYSLKEPLEINIAPVFNYVNAVKRLLIDINQSLSTHISTGETSELAVQVSRFIDACRTNVTEHTEIDNDTFYNDYPLVFDSQSKCRAVAIDIVERVALAVSYPEFSQPYKQYEKIAVMVSPEILAKRRSIIRQTSFVQQYYPSNGDPLTCQMILDDNMYFEYVNQMKYEIVNKCNDVGSNYLNLNSINDSGFANTVNAMGKGINSGNKDNPSAFGDYVGENNKRCFAIFDNGSKRFISFSGVFDASNKRIIDYFGLDPMMTQWNALENAIKQYIRVDPLLKKAKYTKLNLNVITNNYPQETLDSAIKRKRTKDRREFSCCERKMISKTNPVPYGRSYMFTRHKPCPNCEISISDFNKIAKDMKVYYLNESPNDIKDTTIHEFPIK